MGPIAEIGNVRVWLFTQGVLGVMLVLVLGYCAWLILENRSLVRRYVAKSEKDGEKNTESAKVMVTSSLESAAAVKELAAEIRALRAEVKTLQTAKTRRQTAAGGVPTT